LENVAMLKDKEYTISPTRQVAIVHMEEWLFLLGRARI